MTIHKINSDDLAKLLYRGLPLGSISINQIKRSFELEKVEPESEEEFVAAINALFKEKRDIIPVFALENGKITLKEIRKFKD